jgi:DnaJ-domain-containing protein 1
MNLFNRVKRILSSYIQRNGKDESTFQNEYGSNTQRNKNESKVNNKHHSKIAEYYANLEIPFNSDLRTVKSAWKRLMRKYHPDLHNKDPQKVQIAEKLTQRLNLAYSELKDYLEQNANLGG